MTSGRMTRRPAKRRSDAELTEARKTGGRMRAEGYTAQAIATIWAVPPNTVYRWDSRAQIGDDMVLSGQRRGCRQGE